MARCSNGRNINNIDQSYRQRREAMYKLGRIITVYISLPIIIIMMVCIWAEIKRYNDFQEEYKEKQERDKRRKQQREKEIQTMWDHIKEMEQEMMERNLKMQQDPMNICKILDKESNKEIEIPRELLKDPDKINIIKFIEEELHERTTKEDGGQVDNNDL